MASTSDTEGTAASLLLEHEQLMRSVVAWSRWRFSPETRDDVLQKIRLEVLRQPKAAERADAPDRLIKQICIRRCIDEVRRQIRERGLFSSATIIDDDGEQIVRDWPTDRDEDPVHLIVLSERGRAVTRLMRALDETCRVAIQFFYVDGLSYRDMAARLGISTNTVGSRLAKCLDKLRGDARSDMELREYFADRNDQASGSTH